MSAARMPLVSPVSHLTRREDVVAAVFQALCLGVATAGVVVLMVLATRGHGALLVVSCAVYGATLLFLYGASALYHGVPGVRVKRVLRRLDHASIYLLIAGTYTPFSLVLLRGAWGWTLFGIVWGMAAAGVLWKAVFPRGPAAVSLAFYLAMGWAVLIALKPLLSAMPLGGLLWLLAGGLAFTAGTAFFLWERLPYNHTLWHAFVLAGCTCHYVAVLAYVVPAG